MGLLILGWALWVIERIDPRVSQSEMMLTLVLQGFSVGLVFNPMTVMAYTTLSPQLRGEGTAIECSPATWGRPSASP